MHCALFVAQYESEETKTLLREAGELAAGVDAELIVLHVMEESAYQELAESRRSVRSVDRELVQLGGYPITEATDDAEQLARRLGWTELRDLPLDWLAVGHVGRESDRIIEVAKEFEADHMFVVGRRRSPSGKAIFGDLTQRLIFEFPGPVTTLMPAPE